jgi:hypothetical protein
VPLVSHGCWWVEKVPAPTIVKRSSRTLPVTDYFEEQATFATPYPSKGGMTQ